MRFCTGISGHKRDSSIPTWREATTSRREGIPRGNSFGRGVARTRRGADPLASIHHSPTKPPRRSFAFTRGLRSPIHFDLGLRSTGLAGFIEFRSGKKALRGGLVEDIDAQMLARRLVLQDAQESQDSHGQNVRDAFPLGDVFIDATSRVKCERGNRGALSTFFSGATRSRRHMMNTEFIWPNQPRLDRPIYLVRSERLFSASLVRFLRSDATEMPQSLVAEPIGTATTQMRAIL